MISAKRTIKKKKKEFMPSVKYVAFWSS